MSGLFSAVMIGLGRAVGETMIVLMAAGNTPVRQWNIFNGFRTLSANIAVELPEAPVDSTHYRTLFLAALCLFVLTFAVNTSPRSSACASAGGPMSSEATANRRGHRSLRRDVASGRRPRCWPTASRCSGSPAARWPSRWR